MNESSTDWRERNGGLQPDLPKIPGLANKLTKGDGLDIHKKVHRDEIGRCFKKLSNAIVWTLHSLFYK